MIARLFNAPSHDEANTIGTSTIGSSEAIMVGHKCEIDNQAETDMLQLAVLAMKKLWQKKRKAEGKSTENPNIIMNSAVQVCWEVSGDFRK